MGEPTIMGSTLVGWTKMKKIAKWEIEFTICLREHLSYVRMNICDKYVRTNMICMFAWTYVHANMVNMFVRMPCSRKHAKSQKIQLFFFFFCSFNCHNCRRMISYYKIKKFQNVLLGASFPTIIILIHNLIIKTFKYEFNSL